MKALVTLVAAVFVGSPIVAVAITVARASQTSIDRAVLLAGVGVFALCLSGAVAIIINAAANYRAAALPKPSHQIDARTQHIDARRMMLVNANGQPVDLPAGHRIVEVMR